MELAARSTFLQKAPRTAVTQPPPPPVPRNAKAFGQKPNKTSDFHLPVTGAASFALVGILLNQGDKSRLAGRAGKGFADRNRWGLAGEVGAAFPGFLLGDRPRPAPGLTVAERGPSLRLPGLESGGG